MRKLTKLKVFRLLRNDIQYGYMHILCNLTEVEDFTIGGGKDQLVPKCITNLKKLKDFTINVSNLKAFPFELLYMQITRVDLWNNNLTYGDLLEYNGLGGLSKDQQENFWETFPYDKVQNLTFFILNNNQLCDGNIPEPFQHWTSRLGREPACIYQNCSAPINDTVNSFLSETYSPSILLNLSLLMYL